MEVKDNYAILTYGFVDSEFYVVQCHRSSGGNYFSLWVCDGRPDKMTKSGIEEFMMEHFTDGSSVAGTFNQVMSELEDLIGG